MNTRYAMYFIALLLTFIVRVGADHSKDSSAGLALSISVFSVAEAKVAPDAAPGTLIEADSETPAPFEELECHEHHDQEVIAEAMADFEFLKSRFAVLAPSFVKQNVYSSFRYPPRT